MATALATLVAPLASWFVSVSRTVPEPYLDEVFHVCQAQHYCAGHWDVWDSKITTPPGLYLVSAFASSLGGPCDIDALRFASAICVPLLVLIFIYTGAARGSKSAQHHALNLVLFPPLFFFGALYYTDVASTLSVMLFHFAFLKCHQNDTSAWLRIPLLTFLGLFSLLFRQTNIFWVAVFPAGVTLVNQLDRGHEVVKESMYKGSEGFGDSLYSVAKTSWKMDVVYDPLVADGWLEDYLRVAISIATCAVKTVTTQPRRLLGLVVALAPFFTLLSLFGAFIVWNGGVVLGDRSNHIATLHLPQMLYLWPYIAFFSWPQLYPYLLILPLSFFAKLPNVAPLQPMLIFKRRCQGLIPRYWLMALFVALACAVVWANTIVHPFTLADNRHYTFYVFRLLLRRSWIRYAVTPVYVLCAWVCIQALGGGRSARAFSKAQHARRVVLPDDVHPPTATFLLIWLATTALQLVTAPLVEPRYFILPWVFWRMHIPSAATPTSIVKPKKSDQASENSGQGGFDPRLYLETAWLLLVNTATGYIFIKWGYSWPQEPGQTQRFMW